MQAVCCAMLSLHPVGRAVVQQPPPPTSTQSQEAGCTWKGGWGAVGCAEGQGALVTATQSPPTDQPIRQRQPVTAA